MEFAGQQAVVVGAAAVPWLQVYAPKWLKWCLRRTNMSLGHEVLGKEPVPRGVAMTWGRAWK